MNFISSGKTINYERAQRVSKILFLPRLYRQKDIDKIIEGNDRN